MVVLLTPVGADMASLRLHEAICKAAGWPAYCDKCGRPMQRLTMRFCDYSVCSSEECRKKQDEEVRKNIPYWADND